MDILISEIPFFLIYFFKKKIHRRGNRVNKDLKLKESYLGM